MKERKVSPVLFPYLKNIFHNEHIPYKYSHEKDVVTINSDISNRQYGVARMKAKCLMQQMESSTPNIPVLSLWHLRDWKKRVSDDVSAFFILEDEENKFMNIYGK